MEQSTLQQCRSILAQASRCDVFLPARPTADAIAAAAALQHHLTRQRKQVRVIASDITVPKQLAFLDGVQRIRSSLKDGHRFVITVDLTNAQVGKLSYAVEGSQLHIHLTPARGVFSERDVRAHGATPKPDAIVVLDAPDLDALGDAADAEPSLFFSAPVVNIDHHPTNARFGTVNVVELTAGSTSEVLFHVLHESSAERLDEPTATALLTGIMSTTRGFQTTSVTPSTLTAASELVALGARHDVVVEHLLQTKSLPMLHLWGRALARLRTSDGGRLVWTALNRADFERSGGTADDLAALVDELMSDVPQASVITLLYETGEGKFRAIVRSSPSLPMETALQDLHPERRDAVLHVQTGAMTVEEAERIMRERLEPLISA